MVFTSIPAYLDPANWHQQQQPNHHTGSVIVGSSGGSQHQNQQQHLLSPPQPPPLPPPTQAQGVGSSGSIRPGSMADRARMANIPMPETALKCPRCESTNTKFCYFNNYSLSQPRHFCKTCRRYWTRGGALRNVPVGGGCRRNKRSSKGSSRSKSPVSSDRQTGSASSTNSASSTGDIVGLAAPHAPPLRFMSPLLNDYAAGGELGGLNYGLNYNTISASMGGAGGIGDLNFSALSGGGSGSTGTGTAAAGSILFAAGLEQWRMPQAQQYPFLAGLEAPAGGLYPFEGGAGAAEGPGYGAGRGKLSTSGVITQLASVKMEDHNQELNLSRQFMGLNEQYWSNIGGGSGTTSSAWTDLSGFSSSSATSNNPL